MTQKYTGTVERVYRKRLPRKAGANGGCLSPKYTVEIKVVESGLAVEFAVYGRVLESCRDRYGRGVLTTYAAPCEIGNTITVEGKVRDQSAGWIQLKDARLVDCAKSIEVECGSK